MIYQADSTIIRFKYILKPTPIIILVTSNGYIHEVSMKKMQCEKMIKITDKQIIDAFISKDGHATIATVNGDIINHDGKLLLKTNFVGSNVISSLYLSQETGVLSIGTFDGHFM